MNSQEEIDAKRSKREQDQQRMKELMEMQAQAEAYKNMMKSPESGSPAEQMVGV